MGDVARQIVGTGGHILIRILGIQRPNGHGNLADLIIRNQLVGIGTCIGAVIDGASHAQPRNTCIVQTGHVGRTGEVVTLKESLFAASYPLVAVKAVGIQTCHDHRLIVESSIALAKLSEELNTCLMPSAGDDRHLTLRT